MYKPRDSDIFGTSSLATHPKISNDNFVDPHAAFKARTNSNYEIYTNQLGTTKQTITKRPMDFGKVNENVQFDENYHRGRKEKDLQSSIFYPPTVMSVRSTNQENAENNPLMDNRQRTSSNFGRKEVMRR
jgi:hypothetical protein